MIEVTEATLDEIDELIRLESALFEEDAGTHDPYSDPTWPDREGRQDLEDLIGSPESIVLVARSPRESVGFLMGYVTGSSPTRRSIRIAVLRTLFVAAASRRSGAATALTDRFLSWACDQGCVEAHVDQYAANQGAGRFYDRIGFSERSISRVRSLPVADEEG